MASQSSTAVIVGSLRKESFSLKLAKALTTLAPPSLQLDVITLNGLSFYNQDLEATPPADWVSFRDRIRKADAVLFVTPEYNRSVPGVLKNAIDVGSRPYGQSVFNGKPGGVISNSPGAIGGFGANHHLRQSLVFLNMPVLQQPEAYIANAGSLINESTGKVQNDATEKFLRGFAEAFDKWIGKIRG